MSNLAPTSSVEPCAAEPARPTLQELPGRLSDLGGLPIRRLLPRSRRRLVGPWCFLDAYGPLAFAAGKPIDVAPHPHIGLQTVTWLLEGEVEHHDSLGLAGTAVPGALNLMTAGRGIAHAEETPARNGGRLRGVQLWVALPGASRDAEPAFERHAVLPRLDLAGGYSTVFAGRLGAAGSPARTFSPLVGAELIASGGAALAIPLDPDFEHALVPLTGELRLEGRPLAIDALYYLGAGRGELLLSAPAAAGSAFAPAAPGAAGKAARALLIGGAPFEETVLMWWNFVARSHDEIAAAREDWEAGRRFGEVSAYAGPRFAAPPLLPRPLTSSRQERP